MTKYNEDEIKKLVLKLDKLFGIEGEPLVGITDDMTPAEQEFTLYEAAIKKGCSPDEAEKEAKEWMSLLSFAIKQF